MVATTAVLTDEPPIPPLVTTPQADDPATTRVIAARAFIVARWRPFVVRRRNPDTLRYRTFAVPALSFGGLDDAVRF
jgi:hypothetical protein